MKLQGPHAFKSFFSVRLAELLLAGRAPACLNPFDLEHQGCAEWAQLAALMGFLVFGVSL